MAYIDLIYGLAFFSLGLVVGLETFRPITPEVKPAFRNLAAFGLLYAVHQWIEYSIDVGTLRVNSYTVVSVDVVIMITAVIFLARFGGMLISDKWEITTGLPFLFFFILLVLVLANVGVMRNAEGYHLLVDDLSRYFLIFPASVMAAWGLIKGGLLARVGNGANRSDRMALGVLFIVNAIVAGLIVDKAPFTPASWLNTENVFAVTGIPVQLIRALVAIGITIFMVRTLRVFEHVFVKELAVKETMERDAKVAADIQTELVPKKSLKLPEVEIYARWIQARVVGGDTFDYFEKDGIITFMIGDASGKGSPAALLCTAGLITLETELRNFDYPKDVLRATNKRLANRFPSGSFMTAALGRYFPEKKLFELANSGHNPPLIFRHEPQTWRVVDLPGSLPLGVEQEAEPSQIEIEVEPGDRLMLYTDGLIDAKDETGERIGFDNIRSWLNANTDLDSQVLLDNLMAYLLQVCHGELADDVTVVLINVNVATEAKKAA